jgi:hypothetical protein
VRRFLREWKKITRNRWILNIIEHGVKVNLPFIPRQAFIPKEPVWRSPSKQQTEWMDSVHSFGAIEEVPADQANDPDQLIGNLMSEPKAGRVCSNIADLNSAAVKMPLKMESLKDVRERIVPNSFMISLDLTKFFWSTSIFPSHRKFFRFYLHGKLYQWKVLPFGYINSMQIMDRLLFPILQKLNTWGIEILHWVDDLVLMLGPDKAEATAKAQKAIDLFFSLGFAVHPEKTSATVTKEVTFRGFIWNSKTMTVTAPPEKLADIRKHAKSLNLKRLPIRTLATLIGKVRYLAQIHYHLIAWIVECQILVKTTVKESGWEAHTDIPPPVRDEILHWRTRDSLLMMPIRILDHIRLETKGDAGPLGYGYEGIYAMAGLWSKEQCFFSTNWRELMTWVYQAEEFHEHLVGKVSVYATDSTVAVRYIKKVYGKSPILSRISAAQTKKMEVLGIIQVPKHVSQEEIKSSDILSRLREKEDLTATPRAFMRWCASLDFHPTIDAFASRFSAKVPRYFARLPDDQSAGTNAFLQVWNQETLYVFPPPTLIHKTLAKILVSQTSAMLVVRDEPFQTWWPTIKRLSHQSLRAAPNEIVDAHGDPMEGSSWRIFLIHGRR